MRCRLLELCQQAVCSVKVEGCRVGLGHQRHGHALQQVRPHMSSSLRVGERRGVGSSKRVVPCHCNAWLCRGTTLQTSASRRFERFQLIGCSTRTLPAGCKHNHVASCAVNIHQLAPGHTCRYRLHEQGGASRPSGFWLQGSATELCRQSWCSSAKESKERQSCRAVCPPFPWLVRLQTRKRMPP